MIVKNMIGLAPGVTTIRSGVVASRPLLSRNETMASLSGRIPGAGV